MKYLFTVLIVCSITVSSYSQCSTLAQYQYRVLEDFFYEYGFTPRNTYTYGKMYKGQSDSFKRKFYSGNSYVLGVLGDDNATDIDIYIYDYNFNLIKKDTKIDKLAAISFRPRYTGNYYIKVKMYDAYSSSCWTLVTGYN